MVCEAGVRADELSLRIPRSERAPCVKVGSAYVARRTTVERAAAPFVSKGDAAALLITRLTSSRRASPPRP